MQGDGNRSHEYKYPDIVRPVKVSLTASFLSLLRIVWTRHSLFKCPFYCYTYHHVTVVCVSRGVIMVIWPKQKVQIAQYQKSNCGQQEFHGESILASQFQLVEYAHHTYAESVLYLIWYCCIRVLIRCNTNSHFLVSRGV